MSDSPASFLFPHNHHAFCVEGGDVEEISRAVCTQWDLAQTGPDVWIKETDTFSVADAGALRAFVVRTAESGTKAAIVACTNMTREAQNALLKTVEEPRGNTKIILIVPHADYLIPTIRSRVEEIRLSGAGKQPAAAEQKGQEFLAADSAGRLKIVSGMIERKDKREISEFLSVLEKLSYERSDTRMLAGIQIVQRYLSDRGASVKLLLEYLAFLR